MPVKWVQDIYDKIKSWKSPDWFKTLTQFLFDKVVIPTLIQIGSDGISLIQELIVDASKKDMSGLEKFDWVFKEFKQRWGSPLKDRIINLGIELTFHELKEKGIIS